MRSEINRGDWRVRRAEIFIRRFESELCEKSDLALSLKTDFGNVRISRARRLVLDDGMGTREVRRLPGLLKIGIVQSILLARNAGLIHDLDTASKLSESVLVNEKLKNEAQVILFPKNRLNRF